MSLRFAEFLFDEGQRQLFRGNEPVRLEPKAFELLSLLVSRRPDALSKQYIHEVIWPGARVSDSSLPGIVRDLRTALGNDRLEPKLIRTVRGYGYAFCGTAVGDPAPASDGCRWTALRGGREIPLPEGTHLLGRGQKCQINCESVRASRSHAQVRITAGQAFIEDLGSRNGTWLRGERIQGVSEILPGDTVQVGSDVIRFVAAGPEATTIVDGE